MKSFKIALIPDRFALYRYPIFKSLSDYTKNPFKISIFADVEEDIKGIKICNRDYCNENFDKGGIFWYRVKNYTLKKICFWQSKIALLPLFHDYDIYIYWGEANRISTWVSCFFAKLRNKKIVFWSHGLYGNEGLFKLFIRKLFYRLSDAILLYGNYSKNLLIENGFNSKSLFVINNSLNTDLQNELYLKYINNVLPLGDELFSESDFVLLFFGRLEPRKKVDLLIYALERLNKLSNINFKLLIIGEGSSLRALKDLTAALKLKDQVLFYGKCFDEKTLAPLLIRADLSIAPGNVGLFAMHSLIYGTPVLSHNNYSSQMPEFEVIAQGKNGGFFEFDNIESMCNEVLSISKSIERKEINPEACRSSVMKRYSIDYQIGVFKDLLNFLSDNT